jgi:hypothetical protein
MSPRPATKSPARKTRAAAASSSLVATAVARGWDEALPSERMHPEDLAALAAQVTGAVTDHLRTAFAELRDAFLGSVADATALPALAGPTTVSSNGDVVDADELLTVKEVLAVRPKLGDDWLYQNAATCGAIRKHGKRSALLFTLAKIDAELQRRAVRADNPGVRSTAETPAVRGPKRPKGETTPGGNPRSFSIRPPAGRSAQAKAA